MKRAITTLIIGIIFFVPISPVHGQSSLDVRVFRDINNAQSPFLNRTIGTIDYSVVPMAVALPTGFMITGLVNSSPYERVTAEELGASELGGLLLMTLGKEVFKRPRPFVTLSDVHLQHAEPASSYSFPSGHSTAVFAMATILSIRYPKPLVIAGSILYATVESYGRVYLGNHYPSDVLGGALLGVASGLLVYSLEHQIEKLDRRIFGGGDEQSGVMPQQKPRPVSIGLFPIEKGAQITFVLQ